MTKSLEALVDAVESRHQVYMTDEFGDVCEHCCTDSPCPELKLVVAARAAADALSTLRTERDTLAGQVALARAVIAADDAERASRPGARNADATKTMDERLMRWHEAELDRQEAIDVLRAALAGADGQEAG